MKQMTDYSDKKLQILRVVFIIVATLWLLLGIPLLTEALFVSIICVLVAIFCFYNAYVCENIIKQRANGSLTTGSSSQKDDSSDKVKNGEMNYNLLEDLEENNALCYEYETDLCVEDINSIVGNGGEYIDLVKEPDNQYDDKSVAVYLNEKKVAYIYKGRIRDMIHDWIKRKWTFVAYINKFNQSEGKATYKIGFYKPLTLLECETFKIIKISKKADEYSSSRYENLLCSSEGEQVFLEYDNDEYYDDEEYFDDNVITVMNANYEEIGELPSSAKSFLKACEKTVSVLSEVDEDDSKLRAKITIYKIK